MSTFSKLVLLVLSWYLKVKRLRYQEAKMSVRGPRYLRKGGSIDNSIACKCTHPSNMSDPRNAGMQGTVQSMQHMHAL
jgi:hypothetical protein